MNYTCFESPYGWVGVARSSKGISRVAFGKSDEAEVEILLLRGREAVKSDEGLAKTVDLLQRYFSGEPVEFDLDLDLQAGTEFQQKVWKTTYRIPYGEVRSYSWIAREIGKPLATRAVGRAESANPLPIIIPCHRVLRSDGKLGGYSAGLHWKPKLLDQEQANKRES
ncbi:MAG: methylated-DNA--[protein]-cysteine S-methyltransferase [Candidatus Poribacteria bacterium]|nr:methylated-DNA--[protein]-cysteine S-methyltransferase [Candidatus Poribacteria bacterium]MDE0505938.1 methylated-DNA--[protein]-cysteine S-methyltransferase [Candidatus Poribacteria bacterium]